MFAGFDYGTSHCSIGVWTTGGVTLLPLEGVETQIPSTLYADRIETGAGADARLNLDLSDVSRLRFGRAAMTAHLAEDGDGYFVKSPKSFLGAPGLSVEVMERFIGVVAAMMANVKRGAEARLDKPVTQVVIGRPINFQGAGGEEENHQAVSMLVAAARECGFDEISFLYEPVAAAMEYEQRLTSERRVLVVDVGGGTSDCSLMRLGPERRDLADRDADILGHAGERLGGNDYDQMLALQSIMPSFGYHDLLRSGLPIPNTFFVDAVATNDVNAQQRFYSSVSGVELRRFYREARHPERVARLQTLHDSRLNYPLLRAAEETKIELSDVATAATDLSFIEPGFTLPATRAELKTGCGRLLKHLSDLVKETLASAGCAPDVVYLTGGMSRAEVVRSHLATLLPDVPAEDSDHFGSVTHGLTLRALRTFGGG